MMYPLVRKGEFYYEVTSKIKDHIESSFEIDNPVSNFFRELLPKMLEKEVKTRISIEEVQKVIEKNQELFK